MSVDDPRPAAAQRTAAAARGTTPRRRRVATLATWFFVVPLLSFFSFTVVAGATTFDKPQTAKAVKQLPSTQHVIEIEVAKPGTTAPSAGTDTNLQSVAARFSHTDHVVCSVTGSELSQIQQHYSTGRISLSVDSRTIDVVTVYGATDHDLRAYLGTPGLTCVLVQVSHVFFLPFDAHGS
jgi:hypothetical protein